MRMVRALRWSLIAVLLASMVGAAATQQIILWGSNQTTELDGSQPSCLSIGWSEYETVWKPLGYRNYRSYILGENIYRALYIDGEPVEPTSFRARLLERDPVLGRNWVATWTFRFRPGELPDGPHVFQLYLHAPPLVVWGLEFPIVVNYL
ncbi:hypothetical protein ACFLSF_00050 [Candidatus Bipolaricaulota bacterium]